MSFQTRLEDLIDALGTDYNELVTKLSSLGASDIPAYAGSGLTNSYDPLLNAYNAKGSSLRTSRAAMARALNATDVFNILFIGDSSLIGYNGSVLHEENSPPRRVGEAIASHLGVPEAGSGIVPIISAKSELNSPWSVTGTVDITNYPGLAYFHTGATGIFAPEQLGDSVTFYYSDSSVGNFTLSVDGAAPVTIIPTGTSVIKTYVFPALSYGTHVLKVTALGTYLFATAGEVSYSKGVSINNLGWGGARANAGGPTVSWLDTTGTVNINGTRKGTWTASGKTPHLIVISLGGNDIFQGDSVATVVAGLTAIREWYPNADCILAGGWEVPTTNTTIFDALCAAKYALADTLNCVYVDWRDRCGNVATAVANGLTGVDGVHGIDGQNIDFGYNLAEIICNDIGPVSPLVGSNVTLNAPNERLIYAQVNDDGSDTSVWPNRLQGSFKAVASAAAHVVFKLNEYFELRVTAAKTSTTPVRIFSKDLSTDVDHSNSVAIFETVLSTDVRTQQFGVYTDHVVSVGPIAAPNVGTNPVYVLGADDPLPTDPPLPEGSIIFRPES